MELRVAKVGSTRGLKGEVFLILHTDEPQIRFYPGSELKTDAGDPLTVATVREYSGRLAVSFVQCPTREAAAQLRGKFLLADIDEDAEREEDPEGYYPHQLRGLVVENLHGEHLGTVSDLILGGAQDLLQVNTGTEQVLVPFVMELVPEVDLAGGRVVVDPPGGLFADHPGSAGPGSTDFIQDPHPSKTPHDSGM